MSNGEKLTVGEAAALLAWYAEAGIDVALDDQPVDRTRRQARPAPQEDQPLLPRQEAPPPPALPRPAGPDTAEDAARAARDLARAATTLDELRTALAAFDGCGLKLTATQLVFADGVPGSRVMLVGEAPGRDEDIQGLPFVGRSGQLLDRMLGAIGLGRQDVYIANIVPWRPPGNRTPTPQETAVCRPFIQRQIELADPDFLLVLGAPASRELFATADGILKIRGRWRDFDTGKRTIRAMATLHPAYLLRSPLQKRFAWRDFLALKAALEG